VLLSKKVWHKNLIPCAQHVFLDLPSSVTTETEILESQKYRMLGANKSKEPKHKSQKPSKVNFA
jgi:hypothetical protein